MVWTRNYNFTDDLRQLTVVRFVSIVKPTNVRLDETKFKQWKTDNQWQVGKINEKII